MIEIKVSFADFDALYRELDDLFERTIKELINVGERYVNEGRRFKGEKRVKGIPEGYFQDDTTILRNAHSYIIYYNGERIAGVIGRPETLEMFEKMKVSDGLQFIAGNGIIYASFVEGKEYNVCTSAFMQVEREIRGIFKNVM